MCPKSFIKPFSSAGRAASDPSTWGLCGDSPLEQGHPVRMSTGIQLLYQVRISFCLVIAFAGFNVTAAVLLQTPCPAAALAAPVLGREQLWGGKWMCRKLSDFDRRFSMYLSVNFEI